MCCRVEFSKEAIQKLEEEERALQRKRELGADPERWNVHGGAVALGHPIGCSGTRVLVTLLHALQRHDKTTGIAGLCLGGGNAVAMSVERI